MTLVSFAQNFEDVMLWRALGHIERGSYIDVGAMHPSVDSVTRAFYDTGWSGINVEPVEQWFDLLERDRPRDINLRTAATATDGELLLYEIPGTGSSTIHQHLAVRHQIEFGHDYVVTTIPSTTLARICKAHPFSAVNFLKIDVEGAEREVLEGMDFNNCRPWIVLVEATVPNTTTPSYDEWESILLNAGYEHTYFDGINRFYVASEQNWIKKCFSEPPNFFDGFVLSANHHLCSLARDDEGGEICERERNEQDRHRLAEQLECVMEELQVMESELHTQQGQEAALHSELTEARTELDEATRTLELWKKVADERIGELRNIYTSRTWRLTRPIRAFPRRSDGTLPPLETVLSGSKRQISRLASMSVRYAADFIIRKPALAGKVSSILSRYPAMRNLLLRALSPAPSLPAGRRYDETTSELSRLSPRALRFYRYVISNPDKAG